MGKRLSSVFKTSSIGEIILLLDSSVYTVVIYGDLNGLCSVYQYGHTPSRSVLLLLAWERAVIEERLCSIY